MKHIILHTRRPVTMNIKTNVAAALAVAITTGVVTAVAGAQTQDHQYTTADIEAGSRIYSTQCSLCHGPNGDGVSGIDLRRGVFRRSTSDEDLTKVITTGISDAGMPSFKFQPAEINAVISFIRAGFDPAGTTVKLGNAERGAALFAGKGRCATCHRVNGLGPRTAPDLSDIGAIRTPAALQRSLVDPTAAMFPIDKPVRVVTKDGRTIRGRRLNEDTYTVQLIDDKEQLVSLVKANLREYEIGKTSPMPSASTTLSADEIADLVGYLLTLKGR
jgi:putative heme-binding domain-containing protein